MKKMLLTLVALGALLLTQTCPAAPFTPGNIAVVRVGDGAAALSAVSAAAFIHEYTPAGVLVQVIALPAGGVAPLTLAGSSTSEGALTRSPDGKWLCVAGYRAPSGTAGIAATTAAAFPREVATVNVAGAVAVGPVTGTQFSGGNIRSGVTDGANNFWAGGTAVAASIPTLGGVNYLGTASAPNLVLGGNLRWVNIFNGGLYFSSGSATASTCNWPTSGRPLKRA